MLFRSLHEHNAQIKFTSIYKSLGAITKIKRTPKSMKKRPSRKGMGSTISLAIDLGENPKRIGNKRIFNIRNTTIHPARNNSIPTIHCIHTLFRITLKLHCNQTQVLCKLGNPKNSFCLSLERDCGINLFGND